MGTPNEAVVQLVQRVNAAIINPLILLFLAVATLVFLWGLFKFIANSDAKSGVRPGQNHILYGLIGMTIMLGALGILNILQSLVTQ